MGSLIPARGEGAPTSYLEAYTSVCKHGSCFGNCQYLSLGSASSNGSELAGTA
jgi:hypothetical protein